MNGPYPRIAFFPDAFHEVDGVAVVARNFAAYAQRWNIPFLMVHAGPCDQVVQEGSVTRMQLRRSRLKFPLDRNGRWSFQEALGIPQRGQPLS